MKKKSVVLLLAAVISCATVLSGCSLGFNQILDGDGMVYEDGEDDDENDKSDKKDKDDKNDKDDDKDNKDNEKDDNEKDNNGGNIASGADFSIEHQIGIIDQNRADWIMEQEDNYYYRYTVTDLDRNGRLEVIMLKEVSAAALDTSYQIYEVNENADGLNKVRIVFPGNQSMPALGQDNRLLCAVGGYGTEDMQVYGYEVSDYAMFGYSASVGRKYSMLKKGDSIEFSKIGHGDFDYVNPENTVCYDWNEKYVSEDEYEYLAYPYYYENLENYTLMYQYFEFMYLDEGVNAKKLEQSYSGFCLFEIEGQGSDAAMYEEVYPWGWVPENYSGETRYSVYGTFTMIDSELRYLCNNDWSGFEVHGADGIYQYDYADDFEEFASKAIKFNSDGTGEYNDGILGPKKFTYEIFDTELFSNVMITFSDGSMAFAYSADLNNNYGIVEKAIIVSFDDKEEYFVGE